jgi:hypothetical protein
LVFVLAAAFAPGVPRRRSRDDVSEPRFRWRDRGNVFLIYRSGMVMSIKHRDAKGQAGLRRAAAGRGYILLILINVSGRLKAGLDCAAKSLAQKSFRKKTFTAQGKR